VPTQVVNSDMEFVVFAKRIKQRTGIDLSSYKRPQMERRLRALASQHGVSTFWEYYHLLDANPEAMEEFRKRMTINVSELFRNPEKFVELEKDLLPALRASYGKLNIWSAGCSYGAEPYTLAMQLREMGMGAGQARVLATDIDDEMLARARTGVFTEADMRNVAESRRQRFFTQSDGHFQVKAEVRSLVEYRHHDLLVDRFEKGFHLVLCRNVVIYFTDEAKDVLYRRFTESLVPGGVLFVGSTERVFGAREIGLESLGPFFYRKSARSQDTPVGRATESRGEV
jgi:chemotaxis protein methyltransferase CheR